MVSVELLRLHIDYTAWASRRLVEAAAALTEDERMRDFGTADKCVLNTLVHVYAADRIWLRRVLGEPPAEFLTPADFSLHVLEHDWPLLTARWRALTHEFTPDSPLQVIEFKDMRGKAYAQPLWQILLHVVNHATHHRGQVSGFLRAMGKTPPPLDLVRFYRELK